PYLLACVVCFAAHSASNWRIIASASGVWYHQLLPLPLRSFLFPVTCPRFILCAPCVCGVSVTILVVRWARSLGRSSPCRSALLPIPPSRPFSLARWRRHVVLILYRTL